MRTNVFLYSWTVFHPRQHWLFFQGKWLSSNHIQIWVQSGKKKNPCQELSFPYRVVFILLYPTYNIKKKNKSSLNQHFFFSGFSFDFNASTLFGSIIPLLEVLSQGVRTFLLARWDSNTNPKMHSKDLTAHIKNKQQKERKDGVGKSVWQNGKLKAVFQVGSRQGMD